MLAHFYDVLSIITILLDRSGLENWPFVIYPIQAFKIYNRYELDLVDSEIGLETRSNYNILDDKKAVLVGSFDLGDRCFDFTRRKQALAMVTVCLVSGGIDSDSTTSVAHVR